MQAPTSPAVPVIQRTGLPDSLKAGVETLSGMSMDDVHVHYNSSKPAQVQALAYTQGTEIHVGPGQERHLAHEAWHVVQQKQGRVKPTLQMKGVAINDDQGLEREADVMGEKALKGNSGKGSIDYSSVECEKFNLKSLTRPLETGVVSLSIAQLTKMYNHNSKEYFNDEDSEPAPNGYTRVVANPGTTPGWTQTPPLAGSVSLKYLVEQIASARKTNDHDREQQLIRFIRGGFGDEDVAMIMFQVERKEEEERLAAEAPDDLDYYLDKMENPQSRADYVLGLMVRGVPGAGTLLENLETSTGAAKVGFERQVDVTVAVDEFSGLLGVEQNQSTITIDRVFVNADIVTRDMEGGELLIEVKYWPGWTNWTLPVKEEMAKKLLDQLLRLIRTRKKVLLVWLAQLPQPIQNLLNTLKSRSSGRFDYSDKPVSPKFDE